MASVVIPLPLDEDGEDVSWALTTATSLHERGDMHEALRWLRRAVSAALNASQDARAIELGKAAATLEESLSGAATRPGSNARDTLPEDRLAPGVGSQTLSVEDAGIAVDGLDDPTHVDGANEHTVVPFTKKAASYSGPIPSTDPSAGQSFGDSVTMPGAGTPVEREITMQVQQGVARPVNPENESTLLSAVQTAPAGVNPSRVALLAGGDGAPRVILLKAGVEAPDGSAQALLFPMSSNDAERIRQLLKLKDS